LNVRLNAYGILEAYVPLVLQAFFLF